MIYYFKSSDFKCKIFCIGVLRLLQCNYYTSILTIKLGNETFFCQIVNARDEYSKDNTNLAVIKSRLKTVK